MLDVTHGVGHAVAHNVATETPLTLGDPDPSVKRTPRFGVGDEPFPVLRYAPVPHPPRMVAVSHPVPPDAAPTDFKTSVHPTRLFDPVGSEPRRQAVGI